MYGRLYKRFEPEYYWWEVMYLVRRICLTSFRVLMNDRRADVYLARTMLGWQSLCFLVTLIVALLAQFYAHPFKLEHMDFLDATLLFCLFSIVWISMAFDIALKETMEVDVLEGMVFLVIAISCFVSVFALMLDLYHSYLKTKKEPPRWIVFIVFTLTPSPMVAALGLSAKTHKEQVEDIERQLQAAQAAKGLGGLETVAADMKKSRKQITKLHMMLQRKRQEQERELGSDDDSDGDGGGV